MRPSPHIDNKKKDILIYGKGAAQGLVGTTLTAEKTYSINFIEYNKKIRLSLHYNGANSYLFLNGTKTIKSKAKDSEIVATPLYLGNTSKQFSIDNIKNILDFMDMPMILVLIMMLSQLMIQQTFASI